MKHTIIFLLAFFTIQQLTAQSNLVVTYPVAFPMGDLKDYIQKTSWRGISVELNKRVKPDVEVGIESGLNVFYERQDQKVYTKGTSSISGVQYRYTNSAPLLVGAKMFKPLDTKKRANPYLGVGLGGMYVNRATDIGLYRITTETWQFCIRPELGFALNSGTPVSGLLAVKYYASFNNSALNGQSYLTINIGIVSKF